MTVDPGDLPVSTPVGAIADAALDRIAGLVRKVLGVPVALVSLVDQGGQVFPGQSGLPSPWAETRCTPLTHSFCQYVVRSSMPLVIVDARLDARLATNLAIVDINVIAYAGFPLVDGDGAVVGSLCAIDTEPHHWTENDLGLLSDLAAACSTELQLRAAAVTANDAETLSAALLDLSETLSDTLTTAEISVAVSKLSTARLGAAFGGITVLDPVQETLTYVDLGALPGTAQNHYRVIELSADMPSSVAARGRQPFFFETIAQMNAPFPEAARALAEADAGAAAYLPLLVADRVVGTVGILWAESRKFDEADRALFIGLSRYAAQAVERALLLRERRDVAETLQAAMLPHLPVVDGIELVARYLPARTADAVGGDWYDAFTLADQLVLSVGDVQGHDMQAAAVMGQIRSMLRALTSTGPDDPLAAFDALDQVMTALPLGRSATGILAGLSRPLPGDVGAVDDAGVTVGWTIAGHPPPLVIAPDRPAEFVIGQPDVPLGMGLQQTDRRRYAERLPVGSSMLFFTDGLVDRRDAGPDVLLATLRDVADRHRHLDLPEMIDAILADMFSEERDDDLVLLGVRISEVSSGG